MKKLAPLKRTAKLDPSEQARLADLETFERRHFPAWAELTASLANIEPADIAAVLHFAVFNGMVYHVKAGDTSMSYTRWDGCKGRTPSEIAMMFFTQDHWRRGEPLPDREIRFNQSRAVKSAILFADTYRSMIHPLFGDL